MVAPNNIDTILKRAANPANFMVAAALIVAQHPGGQPACKNYREKGKRQDLPIPFDLMATPPKIFHPLISVPPIEPPPCELIDYCEFGFADPLPHQAKR